MLAEVVMFKNRWVLMVAGIVVASEFTTCLDPAIDGLWSKHTLEQTATRINRATAKPVMVLYDALLAAIEPAGETPEDVRKQAIAALRQAEQILPQRVFFDDSGRA